MAEFLTGFRDFLAGFGMVLRVPSVRTWALIPMALNTLLLIAFVTAVFLFTDDVTRWVFGDASSTWGRIAWWLAWFVTLLLGLLLAVGLMLVLSSVVAAPFYTKLSEAALVHVTGRPVPDPSGPIWKIALVSIAQEIAKLGVFIGVQCLLIGIGFIPVVGAIFATGVTWMLLAFEFADYALEACGVPVLARYRFVLAHPGRCCGFGAGAFVVTLIPLLGILTAPAAVAGGARLVARIREEEASGDRGRAA
ncbi:MAG: EI24 domain-containing protein [Candidatus Brocadiae bacterium]|nr:EI24 domain-containing protein [Candidatus Brocadiia bacterium]